MTQPVKRFFLTATAVAVLIAGALGLNALNSGPANALSDADKEEIRAYLIANPEILEEMIAALQAKQEANARAHTRGAIVEHKDTLMQADPALVAGNPDGDITLIEFFDYNCGPCRMAAPHLQTVIAQNPDLRVVFKEFPIRGPDSLLAARAALAAAKQDRYADFHFALMEQSGPINKQSILETAQNIGLDVTRLETDMLSEEVDRQLEANYALAEALGINSTPNFIVGDTLIPGAVGVDVMSNVIADVRENGCAIC